MPISYRLQSDPQVILYFTNKTLPSPSQCCMPDTNQLIQKLQSAVTLSIDYLNPRCLVIDDHGFLVTAHEGAPNLTRFDPDNLSLIDTTAFPGSAMSNVAYHQGAYFLSRLDNTILIVNSSSLALINSITASDIDGPRDMIFLNDGQTMVLASGNNDRLIFFNRSSTSPRNYSFVSNRTVSGHWPHGLWYVNDTLFYVASWYTKNVHSYTTTNNGATWTETLYIDAQTLSSNRWTSHMMIDDCGRRWLSTSENGVLIYNSQGQYLATVNSTWNGIFDAMFLDNYVMLLSDRNLNKIGRLDPQIEC